MGFVKIERKDSIGIIILDRPEKRNALNAVFVSELLEAFEELEKEEQIKIIILRADGEVFSAGADLKYLQELQENSYEDNLDDSKLLASLFLKIYQLKKVVIAEVQGHAIAGGCGLISVCDFVFTVNDAKFGYTEVKIGFVPAIVMVFLLRKLGETHVKELLLSGHLVTAQKALEFGLVNKILEKKDLSRFTESYGSDLVRNNSANSLAVTKALIGKVQSMDLDSALAVATEANATVRNSDDCKRGIEAFLNGEQILW
jgi:methylglutaconyl-CoA hydratase